MRYVTLSSKMSLNGFNSVSKFTYTCGNFRRHTFHLLMKKKGLAEYIVHYIGCARKCAIAVSIKGAVFPILA